MQPAMYPTPTSDGNGKPAAPATTASSGTSEAHKALIAIAMMIAFVIVATVIAGASTQAGHAMLALMVILLLAQGLGHISPFTAWVQAHPVGGTPTSTK